MARKLTNKVLFDLFSRPTSREGLKLAPREILEKLLAQGIETEPRTLRRRLAELVAQGDLISAGAGPAIRYLPRPPSTNEFKLSPDAQSAFERVSESLFERSPSRYEAEFIRAYEPNKTFLLAETLRSRLLDMGRSANLTMPAGTYARDIFDKLVVDLAWASSALEGNTYSLADTKELIERGRTADGADQREAVMILNHKEAVRYLVEHADTIDFDERTIFALHALLSDGLLENSADAGRVRRRGVAIGDSRYVPLSSEERITPALNQILAKARAIQDPIEQAFYAMVMIPYLQPCIDVNKRTSRLAANIPLVKQNLCPLSFIGTPKDHYIKGIVALYEFKNVSLLRDVFAHAYAASCERYPVIAASLDAPDPTRVRYRDAIKSTVSSVVSRSISPENTESTVRELIGEILQDDRDAVRRLVLDDLASLHEGNIARFRLSWHDFNAWEKGWPDSDTRAARLRALGQKNDSAKPA